MTIDYIRQLEVFDPATHKTPVHIIGAGATGSWVALMLSKLGVNNITVWDFDKVEAHNIPNQAFKLEDIGKLKVDAVNEIGEEFANIFIKPMGVKVDGSQRLEGIVFLLTDTMKSRKEIFEKAIRYNSKVKLLIETRMGLDGGRVYTINPIMPKEVKAYEETMYSDEESAVSACGASQSVVATAVQIASYAVWQFLAWHNKVELENEILISSMYPAVMTRRFDDKN